MLTRDSQPRLNPKVRLRFDRHSGQHMLVYPERGMQLDATAAEILQLCDGAKNIATIAGELAQRYAHDATRIEQDALEFLQALSDRCLIDDIAQAAS